MATVAAGSSSPHEDKSSSVRTHPGAEQRNHYDINAESNVDALLEAHTKMPPGVPHQVANHMHGTRDLRRGSVFALDQFHDSNGGWSPSMAMFGRRNSLISGFFPPTTHSPAHLNRRQSVVYPQQPITFPRKLSVATADQLVTLHHPYFFGDGHGTHTGDDIETSHLFPRRGSFAPDAPGFLSARAAQERAESLGSLVPEPLSSSFCAPDTASTTTTSHPRPVEPPAATPSPHRTRSQLKVSQSATRKKEEGAAGTTPGTTEVKVQAESTDPKHQTRPRRSSIAPGPDGQEGPSALSAAAAAISEAQHRSTPPLGTVTTDDGQRMGERLAMLNYERDQCWRDVVQNSSFLLRSAVDLRGSENIEFSTYQQLLQASVNLTRSLQILSPQRDQVSMMYPATAYPMGSNANYASGALSMLSYPSQIPVFPNSPTQSSSVPFDQLSTASSSEGRVSFISGDRREGGSDSSGCGSAFSNDPAKNGFPNSADGSDAADSPAKTSGKGRSSSTTKRKNSSDEPGSGKKRRRTPKKQLDTRDLVCRMCEATQTPEWRRGPEGDHTLCNACGLHWAKSLKREKEQRRKTLEGFDFAGGGGGGSSDGLVDENRIMPTPALKDFLNGDTRGVAHARAAAAAAAAKEYVNNNASLPLASTTG